MIKQLSSTIVYTNPWIRVREDQVEFSNGHTGIYGVVDSQNFALIVPFDGTHLYLVKQFRYPTQQISIEFPQGKHEGDTSIAPADLARMELQEETGLKAKEIKHLGFIYGAPGHASYGFDAFVATGLTQAEQKLDITEADMQVFKVTVQEFETMVKDGNIKDGPTITAYGLLKIYDLV